MGDRRSNENVKRRKYLPLDELDAVSKSVITFAELCEFIDKLVVWATVGFFVITLSVVCNGLFLLTDGRIINMLSPCGRCITVVVPLLKKSPWLLNKHIVRKNKITYLKIGRLDVLMIVGGLGFLRGGLKSMCCWFCDSTKFLVKLCAQHDPNIKESTHMPICCPSVFIQSNTEKIKHFLAQFVNWFLFSNGINYRFLFIPVFM